MLAVVAVLMALFLLPTAAAEASHVQCGDVITQSTKLDSDLLNCPGDGVVIGADDVTLDLNGHVIDGDGTETHGCAGNEFCDVGVVSAGHDGTAVRDGSIRGFAVGVFA